MNKRHFIILIMLVGLLTGCGVSTKGDSFVRENVDVGYIKRVAVLPLENHTKNEAAPSMVRDIIITQGLSMKLFDVVNQSQVDSALKEETVSSTGFDNALLKRLGQRLKVDAFIMGSVDQTGDERVGNVSYPLISLTLRLVDTETGTVIWHASGSGNGYSMLERIFGTEPKDSFQVYWATVRRMLKTLPTKM